MKLSLEDLYELAKDRSLLTPEIYSPNDYYGHAAILKKYAQFPSEYQIKAVIEGHGPNFDNWIWDADINAPLPAFLIPAGAFRYSILRKYTSKALFPIGPMLSHATHFIDGCSINSERQRLGRNLLVFPVHSTHWIDINYDIHSYCQFLEKLGKEFDTIRICLYWKNILCGHAKEYMRHGFECVTAGHMFDPLFLPRLKSIIELATITTSNYHGTHIGYCILMNKPHYFSGSDVERIIERREMFVPDRSDHPNIQEIRRAFAELRDDISHKQREIVEKYWGLSEVKTVEEMQSIFQETEEMYRKSAYFYLGNFRCAIDEANNYVKEGECKQAEEKFKEALAIEKIPEQTRTQAILGLANCYLKQGKYAEAEERFNEVLAVEGILDSEKALVCYNLGSMYERKGDYDRAKEKFETVLSLTEDGNLAGGAHFHLGMIYKETPQNEEALFHLRKCLEVIPNHQKAKKFFRELSARTFVKGSSMQTLNESEVNWKFGGVSGN